MKSSTIIALLAFEIACPAFAIDAPPTDVVLIDHTQVDSAYANGTPLIKNTSFKVNASKRIKPSDVVEIHEHDTDIFYVQEGSATFVTGGTAEEPKQTAPGEIRAKRIVSGTTRHLSKGDVIVIPTGIPHQFTEVTGTFLYFVVKVTK
jgi:quercetin dioxygenase-like cupin family protein